MSEKLKEHPCIQCEMVKGKFPHPSMFVEWMTTKPSPLFGLEQALDHLLQDCPKREDKELSLNVETLGGDY